MFWCEKSFCLLVNTCLKICRCSLPDPLGNQDTFFIFWTARNNHHQQKNMVIKRKPPNLPPDDRKRLRMVCAERAVGRGRPTSVSTSSFQDAMELLFEQRARLAFYKKNPTEKGEVSLHERPIVRRKTYDAYADAAVSAMKLIEKISACNKDTAKVY